MKKVLLVTICSFTILLAGCSWNKEAKAIDKPIMKNQETIIKNDTIESGTMVNNDEMN